MREASAMSVEKMFADQIRAQGSPPIARETGGYQPRIDPKVGFEPRRNEELAAWIGSMSLADDLRSQPDQPNARDGEKRGKCPPVHALKRKAPCLSRLSTCTRAGMC